ncbi:MAG: zinc ribbon domain-containing protein, partial [Pseudomonadota bacterium]
MMQCQKCGSQNPSNHKFCAQCGQQFEIKCHSCGFNNQPDNNFCGGCGQSLKITEISQQTVKM